VLEAETGAAEAVLAHHQLAALNSGRLARTQAAFGIARVVEEGAARRAYR